MTTVFTNGRFFTGSGSGGQDDASFEECMVIENNTITHVGSVTDDAVTQAKANGAAVQHLGSKYILPGFIDGHMHLLLLGQSLQKLDLDGCTNLNEIRTTVSAYAKSHPETPRILCKGWMQSMTDNEALASMLDDLDSRPIYIDAKDLHSTWCNSAALRELDVDGMADPPGGTIHRDENGKASGLLSEAVVFSLIWPHLARVASMEDKLNALRGAISAYTACGYTGLVDMAMDDNSWETLLILRQQEQLTLRIAAHWLIVPSTDPSADLAQVERAIELHGKYNLQTSPEFRIAGIKVICDGVIDGCTAALLEPYTLNGISCDPLWPAEKLEPVVRRAVQAGLQCALHAIGDATVHTVLNVLEAHANRDGRHRIEHLEMTTAEDAARLGKLGITASVQPVHSDPDILRAWPSLIGHERCRRAFAYRDFLDGGATLAFGSDSPTAPFKPFPNVYTATTRKSARLPDSDETVNPNFALPLVTAMTAATAGAAYSCFADSITGRLQTGLSADFVVVDMVWSKDKLLQATVEETWFNGVNVFRAKTN
ncbi:amidohydrolase 3 [Talaromyces proteolyticus]|uniref:Amidohydrolase 3 n=1 Tax=Talaromyces proteolyticus TaxID=1131652 RepID=A0AAD4Q055_9EURO|nr:amidohydrolase 3 [Talaromyces proteolyticus]KAH8696681.1 amidohydrolase 3 [Talaromyces proteolyticus]